MTLTILTIKTIFITIVIPTEGRLLVGSSPTGENARPVEDRDVVGQPDRQRRGATSLNDFGESGDSELSSDSDVCGDSDDTGMLKVIFVI